MSSLENFNSEEKSNPHHQEIIPPEKCHEKIEFLFDPDLDLEVKRDIIESFFISLILEYCPKIDEGAIGIVIDLSAESIPDELREHLELIIPELKENKERPEAKSGLAAKILKIYLNGAEEREYNLQATAHEIINCSSLASKIKVPKPIAHHHFFVASEEIREEFRQRGVYITEQHPDIGFLVMDKVPGITLRTYLYQKVLRTETELLAKIWPNKNEQEREKFLSEMPELYLRQLIETIWGKRDEQELDELVIERLRGQTDIFPVEKVGILSQAINLLNDQGFYHRDLHFKNLMIGNDGQLYIIDFDRSIKVEPNELKTLEPSVRREEIYKKAGNHSFYDDNKIVNLLRQLNTERLDQNFDQLIEATEELKRHLSLKPKNRELYDKMWSKLLIEKNLSVETAFDNFISEISHYRWENKHLYLKLKIACLLEVSEKIPERKEEVIALCESELQSSNEAMEIKLFGHLLKKITS